jgi:hypothetical protein
MVRLVLRSVFVALLLTFAAIGIWTSQAQAKRQDACSVMIKCDLDGEYMSQEETYYNGMHKSVKYGHDYYGSEGKIHHYVIVSCN